MIYLLTAIGLSPGASSTVHIYTQTVHRTTQNKQYIEQHKFLEECGPCPVMANYTLTFAIQLRKKHCCFKLIVYALIKKMVHSQKFKPINLRVIPDFLRGVKRVCALFFWGGGILPSVEC